MSESQVAFGLFIATAGKVATGSARSALRATMSYIWAAAGCKWLYYMVGTPGVFTPLVWGNVGMFFGLAAWGLLTSDGNSKKNN
jgi:hypothetical protein